MWSPDIGRSAVTGVACFHDNSAKTLEDVLAHYTKLFDVISGGFIHLTPQDEADMVADMKLLR